MKPKPTKPSPGRTIKPAPKLKVYYPLLFVVGITLLVYLPAFFNGFVLWDDHTYTWENQFLKNFNFKEVFSFSTFFLGNYHPLTLLWLHLEYLLFPSGNPTLFGGLNPFWFHANNIFLHLVNTTLVFIIVWELRLRKEWKSAAVAALIFGIHPMHVESVAWVSELKDVLYGFFYLAGILVYIRFIRNKKIIWLLFCFVLFILSNLSKAQAVTLPLIMLLIDWYLGRRSTRSLWLEKVPFLLLAIFFGLLAIKAQVSAFAMEKGQPVSFNSLINAGYGLMVYLFKFIFPVHLSAVIPYQFKNGIFPWYFYTYPLIIAAIVIILIVKSKKSKDWLFGLGFFLIAISVMIKLVPVGDSLVNERYSYIPYIGLAFMAGRIFEIGCSDKKYKLLSNSLLAIFCLILAIVSVNRISIWKDTGTFWKDLIVKYPDYWRGYYGWGVWCYDNSDPEEAMRNAQLACDRDPPAAPFMLRGTLYVNYVKDFGKAEADFKKVVSFHEKGSPFEQQARQELANLYTHEGHYNEAIDILNEVIRLGFDESKPYILRAKAWEGLKKFSDAEADYNKAISLDKNNTEAYLNRGMLYVDYLSEYQKALTDFTFILDLVPGQPDADVGIGYTYFKMNRFDESIAVFDRILKERPNEGRVWYFRAIALAADNKFTEAYDSGLKALENGFGVNQAEIDAWKKKSGK